MEPLVGSARRSRTRLVWVQICKQLQRFDSWLVKHGYYGLHCLTGDFFSPGATKTRREGGYRT